eukprot:COSAG06_NODE_5808_length_3262_cov_1.917800_2_plen_187_part_00
MKPCDGSAAQRWELTTAADSYSSSALPGSLVSAASGQCLDVDGCDAPSIGTDLLMWACNSAYPGNNCNSTNQLWSFENTQQRSGMLTTAMDSAHGHLCLEAPLLQLVQCDTSNPDQKWTLRPNGTLVSIGQGVDKCVSIPTVHAPPPPPPSPPAPSAESALNNHSIAVQINGARNVCLFGAFCTKT